jgi:hypothetical protein
MDDVEPHGRELYARCLSGEFGEIAPMEPRNIPEAQSHFELPPEYKLLEKFLIEVNQENGRKSPRSVAIVWASILENLLDRMIEYDISGPKGAGQPTGKPPDTFYARIELAKTRGLIDDADAEKCHLIRRVRNAAAHDWQLSLERKDVLTSLCALYQEDHSRFFVYHEDLDFLIQQIYSGSCGMLAVKFARSFQKPIRD